MEADDARQFSPFRVTPHHSAVIAHRLTLEGAGEDALAQSLATARVDMNPHQVDAALFALASPLSKGALLADEVGLGKTIEAALVIAQRWAERRRRLLLVVPASLRKQWATELAEKFSLPSVILEGASFNLAQRQGTTNPFDRTDAIVISSYEYASRRAAEVRATPWDLIVFDEAHRLRNVWRGASSSQRATALKDATADTFKLLLTATPLQNSLLELFGLVSMIDDSFFGSEGAFREAYMMGGGAQNLPQLRERMGHICRRTLRRQVQQAGLISYTNRNARTFQFEASDAEFELYERVSAYLQRRDTLAFGDKPNGLIILVFRKILGSSTFAVVDTLRRVAARLAAMERPDAASLGDIESADEAEEADGLGLNAEAAIDPKRLAAELEELRAIIALADTIGENEKGGALVRGLPEVLDQIAGKGGQRKAVIFTESVRTQRYLAELLAQAGYAGRIVLMNGSNADEGSKAIYRAWMERHKGSDVISGSRTADTKAAIVEAFRNDATILIATESGAEGINLQFCSLVVNYDLPWNPQRVEQRIGRCHRYGQKIDVTIVNFLNLKNHAEKRVHELLESKFRLFEGVFGASDEVLGAIETGVDIERRILEIVQSSRTADEIDAGFDELQRELSPGIDAAMRQARTALLENVDDTVIRRLKARKGEIEQGLSAVETDLMRLAQAELPDAHFPGDDTRRFEWNGATYCTDWPRAGQRDWKFFRLTEGTLAAELAERARVRPLEPASLTFQLSGRSGGRLSDLELFAGRGGWLEVSRLTLKMADRMTGHLLFAAITDDGATIADETAARLFELPAAVAMLDQAPPDLAGVRGALAEARRAEADARNARWLEEESDKLDLYAADLDAAAELETRALAAEIKAAKKALRSAVGQAMEAKLTEKRRVNAMEARLAELKFRAFERQREVRAKVEAMLDEAQARLRLAPQVTPLFKVRWALAD